MNVSVKQIQFMNKYNVTSNKTRISKFKVRIELLRHLYYLFLYLCGVNFIKNKKSKARERLKQYKDNDNC
jgi:hypothetical protein